MDFYLNNNNCTQRLINEYKKYGKLIVAYDFDNTVYDFHSKGYKFNKIIDLIRECYDLNFYLIVKNFAFNFSTSIFVNPISSK